MACFRVSLLFACALTTVPALNTKFESTGVKVPAAIQFLLRHNHESCSVKAPRFQATTKNPSAKLVHEQNKAKSFLMHVFNPMKGVDFTGEWMMDKIDGDMDKMLMEMGMNAMERQAARMFNYGVGHVTEKIKQNGDDFTITVSSIMGSEEKHYMIGSDTEMEEKSEHKKNKKAKAKSKVTCKTSWAGADKDELVVDPEKSKGKSLPQLRRSLVGDKMVVKMILDEVEVSVSYKKA